MTDLFANNRLCSKWTITRHCLGTRTIDRRKKEKERERTIVIVREQLFKQLSFMLAPLDWCRVTSIQVLRTKPILFLCICYKIFLICFWHIIGIQSEHSIILYWTWWNSTLLLWWLYYWVKHIRVCMLLLMMLWFFFFFASRSLSMLIPVCI